MNAEPTLSGLPPPTANQSQDLKASQQQHTRTYQACIPCRKRKVRCDLGPVDNPHDPPCARCKRESKECYFSNTRRRRRDEDEEEEFDEHDPDNFDVHKNRKVRRSFGTNDVRDSPLTPGGSAARNYPLKRPTAEPRTPSDEEDQEVNNDTAALLQKTEVFSGHDALNLLYQAAGHTGDIKRHRSASGGSLPRPSLLSNAGTPVDAKASPRTRLSHPTGGTPGPGATPGSTSYPKDTSVGSATVTGPLLDGHPEELEQASKAWMKLRFVRAGWFTAAEAILYIDYFYRYLSPLTPIPVPDFHRPSLHAKLLAEEPMLAVTLLTVASRHARLSGPGAESRAYAVHEKLWTYLQGMIDRMIWGQEQFGGGFCGAGFKRGGGSKGLRTIGTIESLLILTEWHPRALHFPPGDDNDELIIGEDEKSDSYTPTVNLNDASSTGRIDSWLEPCWRSDRMSWSLLANAMALAYELGILSKHDISSDGVQLGEHETGVEISPAQKASARRTENVRRLLYIYVNLTAGRLSLPSMLSEEHCNFAFSPEVLDAAENRAMAKTAVSPEADNQYQLELVQDVVLYYWCKLVGDIIKAGNRELFPSREFTRELINNNKYVVGMDKFLGLLKELRMKFDNCPVIPSHMRHVLNIEFEYAKVYISTLGLQAIIERCTNNNAATEQQAQPTSIKEQSGGQRTANAIISAQMLRKWLGTDWKYIQEIIGGSRNLLQVIVDGLYPNQYLKHATVRTYFRINAVSMVLLKTFAVGATGSDFAVSVKLMDKAAHALRDCIVDDVHVGARFAQLLLTLNNRVRSRIIRITANGESSTNGSRAQSPVREGHKRQHSQPSQQQIPTPNTLNARAPQSGVLQRSPSSNHRQQQSYVPSPSTYLNNQYQPYNSPTTNYFNMNNQQGYSPYTQQQSPHYHGHRRNASFQADPLAGISPSPYDQANPQFSIMPPPAFMQDSYSTSPHLSQTHYSNAANSAAQRNNTNNADDAFMTDDSSNFFGTIPGDWMALPLDPLLNNVGADVTQTGYGPDVGGLDMLDILLQEDRQDSNGISGWQR